MQWLVLSSIPESIAENNTCPNNHIDKNLTRLIRFMSSCGVSQDKKSDISSRNQNESVKSIQKTP